jgi:hypothetical protein
MTLIMRRYAAGLLAVTSLLVLAGCTSNDDDYVMLSNDRYAETLDQWAEYDCHEALAFTYCYPPEAPPFPWWPVIGVAFALVVIGLLVKIAYQTRPQSDPRPLSHEMPTQ